MPLFTTFDRHTQTGEQMTTTNLTLSFGSHKTREKGMCTMEAVAFLAGEEHSDRPQCTCPVLAAYARTLNDYMGKGPEGDVLRNKYLLPLTKKLIGTRSTPEVEIKRAFFFADKAVRLFAPLALETARCTEMAETLRALPKIVDQQTANNAALAAHKVFAAITLASATYATAFATVAIDATHAATSTAYAAAATDPAYAVAQTAANAAHTTAETARTAYTTWEQAAQVLAEACEIKATEHEE
jgi:hypothetical protein